MRHRAEPDFEQKRLIAAVLQAALLCREVTMDVARLAVATPDSYSRKRISNVPAMLRDPFLRCTAVCHSCRSKSKSGTLKSWTLKCRREVVDEYLNGLQIELGPAYPVVLNEHIRAAEPRIIARVRKQKQKRKPAPGQKTLFDAD